MVAARPHGRVVTDATDLERLAWHEAAHAVVALTDQRRVQLVTIDPLLPAGLCAPVGGDGSVESLRQDLRGFVAGKIGETFARHTPDRVQPEEDEDSLYPSEVETNFALQLDRHIAANSTEDKPDGGALRTDDDVAAELARRINPSDPDAEINLARELAERTLAVRHDLLDTIAEALLVARTLTEQDLAALAHTEGAIR
jgi:hypothetical protein